MFKRIYHRWRYKKLPEFDYRPTSKYLQWFERIHRLCVIVPIKNTDYRTRIKYTIKTKTNNLGELILLLDKLNPIIKARLPYLDTTRERYSQRSEISIDRWLVNIDGLPYTEVDAIELLLTRTQMLYDSLIVIKKETPSLYAYYNQGLIYVIQDILEFIDTLLAMQLSIERVYIDL